MAYPCGRRLPNPNNSRTDGLLHVLERSWYLNPDNRPIRCQEPVGNQTNLQHASSWHLDDAQSLPPATSFATSRAISSVSVMVRPCATRPGISSLGSQVHPLRLFLNMNVGNLFHHFLRVIEAHCTGVRNNRHQARTTETVTTASVAEFGWSDPILLYYSDRRWPAHPQTYGF